MGADLEDGMYFIPVVVSDGRTMADKGTGRAGGFSQAD